MNYIAVILSFLLGAGIAYLNYRITLKIMKKNPDKAISYIACRQIINLAFLFLVFLVGRAANLNVNLMLIAAAVGLSVLSLILTISISNKIKQNPPQSNDGKGSAT